MLNNIICYNQMSKKDAETLKLERIFQSHSLDNLIFGSRSRSRCTKNQPAVVPPAKKPAPSISHNSKKQATIRAKKEQKERSQQEPELKGSADPRLKELGGKASKEARKSVSSQSSPSHELNDEEEKQSSPVEESARVSESAGQESSPSPESKSKSQSRKVLKPSTRGKAYEKKEEKIVLSRKKSLDLEKSYSLNRIFRKTKKIEFPSIKLEGDLFRISIQNFVKSFQHFDIVHCSLPIEVLVQLPTLKSLIQKGFVFIWVERAEIQMGYHLLNRLGFDVIDQIMWVKTNQDLTQLQSPKEDGELFSNCRSTCLIGYKCILGQKTQYCTKISNNLIFSPLPAHPLEKPEEIYEIGDLMMPGAKKIEIGYKEVGGWLTIKHKEESLYRCHQCLRRKHPLFLIVQIDGLRVECLHCNQGKEQEQRTGERKVSIAKITHAKDVLCCTEYVESKSSNGLRGDRLINIIKLYRIIMLIDGCEQGGSPQSQLNKESGYLQKDWTLGFADGNLDSFRRWIIVSDKKFEALQATETQNEMKNSNEIRVQQQLNTQKKQKITPTA